MHQFVPGRVSTKWNPPLINYSCGAPALMAKTWLLWKCLKSVYHRDTHTPHFLNCTSSIPPLPLWYLPPKMRGSSHVVKWDSFFFPFTMSIKYVWLKTKLFNKTYKKRLALQTTCVCAVWLLLNLCLNKGPTSRESYFEKNSICWKCESYIEATRAK